MPLRISSRTIVTVILAMSYLLIALGPIIPLVAHSHLIPHPVTGECSGDCAICGCSPERSASRTCCCWQKRLCCRRGPKQVAGADCCRKTKRVAKGSRGYSVPPCGSGNRFATLGGETFEQLHTGFASTVIVVLTESTTSPVYPCPAERYDDPPDPPPKLVVLS